MRSLYPSRAEFWNVIYFYIFWGARSHFSEAEGFVTQIFAFVEVGDGGQFFWVWEGEEGFCDVILSVYFFLGKSKVDYIDKAYVFYCFIKLGG